MLDPTLQDATYPPVKASSESSSKADAGHRRQFETIAHALWWLVPGLFVWGFDINLNRVNFLPDIIGIVIVAWMLMKLSAAHVGTAAFDATMLGSEDVHRGRCLFGDRWICAFGNVLDRDH